MQYGLALSAMALALSASRDAPAADLQPHEAVYDLALVSQTADFNSVDGRIALQLKTDACAALSLDYRFVARFHEDDELTVTDQQTLSKETRDGKRYEFRTRTLVDGTEQSVVEGVAVNDAEATHVRFETPVKRETELPLSVFPLGHTAKLIDRALAGDRMVQAKLFDGDDDADKLLTTTSLILPAKSGERPADAGIAGLLDGLRSWNITESYYNSDSDDDGMPVFETRYRLYENGVTDRLRLDFGEYTLEGGLARLSYYGRPTGCPASP
ncbi:DUF1849 family protein [Aureimonas flava]|uniref:DUF1849 family protein n=1 Tax=Aureimonas flava TaxID=2320271 RepID=A0A3A1WUE5_9HYPH|nr:DUF1849 family protein [Aureimonas flava]RIY01561.1 DUF1849 family protein [Aureimonas flava]